MLFPITGKRIDLPIVVLHPQAFGVRLKIGEGQTVSQCRRASKRLSFFMGVYTISIGEAPLEGHRGVIEIPLRSIEILWVLKRKNPNPSYDPRLRPD